MEGWRSIVQGAAIVLDLLLLAVHAGAQAPDPLRSRPVVRALFDDVHRMVPWEATNTFTIEVVDLDADGDVDVYRGNSGGDDLWLNDGTGRLESSPLGLPAGIGQTGAAAFGDLDGDGDPDAILGQSGRDKVLRNRGRGRFDELVNAVPLEFDTASEIVLADFNGDGDRDFLAGNWFSSTRLFANGGAGTFTNVSSSLPSVPGHTTGAASGDLDGDGDADLILVPSPRLFRNDGAGTFSNASANLAPNPYVAEAPALGDVDGDGDLDLYMGNSGPFGGPSRDTLYENDGAGAFSDVSSRLPDLGGSHNYATLGDLDSDGDLDVVAGASDRVLQNDGGGTFEESPGSLPPAPLAVTIAGELADMDGDLDLDLFLGRSLSEGAVDRLYLNDGDGLFADVTHDEPVPVHGERGEEAAWADVDADGDLDGIVANGRNYVTSQPEARNRLLRNDGTGHFADDAADLSSAPSQAHAVALGDLDGDGDPDVVFGNSDLSFGVQNTLFLNDGAGVFAAGRLPTAQDVTEAAALADLDADGDLDLVLGNDADLFNRLLLNDGSAQFTDESQRLPVQGDRTVAIAVADVEHDGDLDLLLGNRSSQPNRLLLNNGGARFMDGAARLPPVVDDTRAVLFGDVDKDGDADVYAASFGQDQLWLNDGRGAFHSATASALPADDEAGRSAAMGDVDGDGDPDLVLAINSIFGGRNRLYANDGLGRFAARDELLPARDTRTYHVSLPDVDGDGDLDLFYVEGDSQTTSTDDLEDQLFFNPARQLSWSAPPAAGKPLAFRITGGPDAPWILYASQGRDSIPVPGRGTLFLDTATMSVAATGATDAHCASTVEVDVPDALDLVGVTLYWQALVGAPPRFTNFETTVLTRF